MVDREPRAPKPKDIVSLDETLFDDAIIDAITPEYSTPEQTMRSLGITKPEPVIPELKEPKPGASVDLEMRFSAASTIMKHFNHQAILESAKKVRGVGGNKFDSFYNGKHKNPDAWFEGMKDKDAMMGDHAKEALDVLNASDAMYKAGFEADEIAAARRIVQRETSDFLPGASNGPARAKKLTVFEKTAERAAQVKKETSE
ncbi:MAG: hypothetical protein ABIP50_01265 [Candidatus Saccharimonadales bacterium]